MGYKVGVETINERRRRKLSDLVRRYERTGGLSYIAAQAGVNEAGLQQVLRKVLLPRKRDGTRSPRALGDRAARRIERALGLGVGWFDAPGNGDSLAADAMSLAEMFDQLPKRTHADLDMRQRLYWAIVQMIRGPGR